MAYRWRFQPEEAVSEASPVRSESPPAHFCCEHFAEVSDQIDRLESLIKVFLNNTGDINTEGDLNFRLKRIEQLIEKLYGKQEDFSNFLNQINSNVIGLSRAKFECKCGCVCRLGEGKSVISSSQSQADNSDVCLSLVKNLRDKISTHISSATYDQFDVKSTIKIENSQID